MEKLYVIGGSPCAGKSTAAEILARKYDLFYYKVDDLLDGYTRLGALAGRPICGKWEEMNAEQIWMRDPELLCREEFLFYEEVFPYVWSELGRIACEKRVITEGAAYVPRLMKKAGLPCGQYLAVTPTEEFQVFHFRQREFVPYVLKGCRDPERAFLNWMDRDIRFAREVRRQCGEEGYVSIINDGTIGIDQMASRIADHFGLEEGDCLPDQTNFKKGGAFL